MMSNFMAVVLAIVIAFFGYPADAWWEGRGFGEVMPPEGNSPYRVNEYLTETSRVSIYEIVNTNDPERNKIVCVRYRQVIDCNF